MTDRKPLHTIRQTAELLGLSEMSVWDLIRTGRLASVKIPSARGSGKRFMRRVEDSEIERFIADL
jgi:predicted DNA-binding transcriptional regulator AlpA